MDEDIESFHRRSINAQSPIPIYRLWGKVGKRCSNPIPLSRVAGKDAYVSYQNAHSSWQGVSVVLLPLRMGDGYPWRTR